MKRAKFLLSAVALVAVIGAITSSKATPADAVYITSVPGPCPDRYNVTLEPNKNLIGILYASLMPNCPNLNAVYQPL